MKKKNLIVVLIIAAAFLLLIPLNTIAAMEAPVPYSGAWDRNSDDAFFIELTPDSGSGSLYMYDWNNDDNLLIINDNVYESNTIYFLSNDSGWYASDDNSINTGDLLLGDDTIFGLYFYDGVTKYFDYTYELTSGDSYKLVNSNTNMTVVAHDINPVPIPATVWIFGAGLIGLVGIRRKLKS